MFNDDVQGTGAVVMAALYSAGKATGIAMRDQKVVVFGAGTAGIGVADQIRDAMVADGATVEQATAQIWPIDKQGLLFDDMDDLRDFQTPYAKNRKQLGVASRGSGGSDRQHQDGLTDHPARLLNGARRVHSRRHPGDGGLHRATADLPDFQPHPPHGGDAGRRHRLD